MPEETFFHLPEKYKIQLIALLKQYIPDAEVWAYGSRVHGDHYEASDIDLVAHFPPSEKRDIFRLTQLKEAFVESHLPLIVQIVDWDNLPPAFREEIHAKYFVIQKRTST